MATIIIMHLADDTGLKGKVRQGFGWLLIVGSDVAFAGVMLFSAKRLFVTELAQQSFVDTVGVPIEIGIVLMFIMMGVILIWRGVDFLKSDGLWRKELDEANGAEEVH
jgi:hypothetical protein